MTKTSPFLSALLALAACGGRPGSHGDDDDHDDQAQPDDREHTGAGESWTVLVYLVADNDLEPFGMGDLEEMMQVGAGDSFRFVVQADRTGGYLDGAVGNLDDFTGTKRLLVEGGGATIVDDLGEANMGDPDVLADFVAWGLETYPADHTALVLWDHGAGWSGFGLDQTSGPHEILDLAEIQQGIAGGLERADHGPLALLGFDACLMSTVEVAVALRADAEYLVASEELVPGHGWDYGSFAVVRDDPTTTPADVGAAIVEGFAAQATQLETVQETTMAVVDLYALDPVVDALGELSAAMVENLDAVAPTIARGRAGAVEFGQAPDPAYAQNLVDLGDMAAGLGASEPSLAEAAGALLSALDRAVVFQRNGAVKQGATGLSIYFPAQAAHYSPDYDAVGEGLGWHDFLAAYYGLAGGGVGPSFLNPDGIAEGQFEEGGGLTAWGTLAPGAAGGVAAATLTYGVIDTESQTLIALGEAPAWLDGDQVVGTWDLTSLVMRQGDAASWAYASVELADDGHTELGIPLGYAAPGDDQLGFALLAYLFDGAQQLVGSTYYLFADNGGVGELDPADGSAFVPLLSVMDAAGNVTWEPGSDPQGAHGIGGFDANTAFDLAPEPLGQGTTVFMLVSVVDYAGNGAAVLLTATL